MTPPFLKDPRVIKWLDGIQPVWTLLEFRSYCRLKYGPDSADCAMQLALDLTSAEVLSAPIVTNTLTMLHMAEGGSGIKLTERGNLTRAAVAELGDACRWPNFDIEVHRSVSKVLNALDVWPLDMLHRVTVEARLLRRRHGSLLLTRKGQAALAAAGSGDLLAWLFEVTFWRINLAYWDGLPVQSWPQSDIGVVSWCLSQCAGSWETPARLARLATIPVPSTLDVRWDFPGGALEQRILRILAFFGVLEVRRNPNPTDKFVAGFQYRKTPFFDRFFSFDVALERRSGTLH